MPSASKNIGCSNTSYKYTISVSWSESSPSVTNNTSKITASGSMSASNVAFSASTVYNYYLRLYWHDNRTNTDTLFASSGVFHSCGMGYGSRSVSGSITVTHKNDGSLSGYVKMKFESPSTSGGWAPVTSWVQTSNTALTTIARASSFSFSSYSNLGSAVNITIDRKSTNFTHVVKYSFAGSSTTTVTSNAATSSTFTPPLSLASRIPNSTTGSLTVSVTTMNGSTQIGSTVSKSVNLGVPSSVVPTMGAPTATRVDNGVPSDWGVYVQSVSKCTVKINSAAGAYGSTIKSYSITGGGLNSTSSSATTGVLTSSGTITFTCKITDSRGRTASKTVSISVVAYSAPSIKVSAERCDADGNVVGDGTYLKVTADYTIASVSSKNSVSSKKVTCNGVSNTTFADNTAFVFEANVSIGSTYILTASVTDALGKSASASVEIPTSLRIINVRKTKKGLAIGKFSEKDEFEVALPSDFQKKVVMHAGLDVTGSTVLDSVTTSGAMTVGGAITAKNNLTVAGTFTPNGSIGAQLKRTHNGSSWIQARNVAILRGLGSSGSNFVVTTSQKTPKGSWNQGTLSESLYFSYDTDTNYNANKNRSTQIRMLNDGSIAGKFRFTYSTSEQWTGEYWIDGKKIYIYKLPEYYSAATGTIDKAITAIDGDIIDNVWFDCSMSFICFNTGSNWEYKPIINPNSSSSWTIESTIRLTGNKSSANRSLSIRHNVGSGYKYGKYFHIFIKYTKV